MKINLIFVLIVLLISCRTTLRTLQDERIPLQVKQHFDTLTFESAKLLIPKSILISDESNWYIYSLSGIIDNGQVIGHLEKTTYSKDSFVEPPTESKEGKKFNVKFKTILCCTNHQPNDCVKSEKAAADSTNKKGCSKWTVRLI